jgi:hypothetical protein
VTPACLPFSAPETWPRAFNRCAVFLSPTPTNVGISLRGLPMFKEIEPKIDSYDSHGVKTRPPAAAKFGVGATSLPEINDALDQRRAHNSALSDPGRKGYEKQSPNS